MIRSERIFSRKVGVTIPIDVSGRYSSSLNVYRWTGSPIPEKSFLNFRTTTGHSDRELQVKYNIEALPNNQSKWIDSKDTLSNETNDSN